MFYLIYKITNIINGRYYIGAHQTVNKNDSYMGSGLAVNRAYEKHGKENFVKEIIAECSSEEDMYSLEKKLVVPYMNDKQSYNIMEGGVGGFNYINQSGQNGTKKRLELYNDPIWHAEWKEKQRIGSTKYSESVTSEEYTKRGAKANETALRNNGVYSFEGKHHSDATKAIIGSKNSINQSSERNSRFGSIWITNGIISKSVSKNTVIPDGWYKGRKIK